MYRAIYLNVYEKINDVKNNNKPHVLVVGNGWSGNSFSKNLDKTKYNLTIVDKNDFFLETHKMSSKFNPIKKINIPNSHFIQDEVKKINTTNNQVILRNKTINYDYLVFALGSEVNTFNIPGTNNCMFYKTREDLYNIKQLFNKDIAIIGGGVTGIELAYKLYKNNPDLVIIEAVDILPGYSENTKNKIKKDLESKKIILYNKHKATEIRPTEQTDLNKYKITLNDVNKNIFCLLYDNIIWTAGIKHHTLKPELTENVFIIGDNSKINPPTAQKAKQEGRWLAKYFNNGFNDKCTNFEFTEKSKIIHTDDGLYIEINSNYTIWLPECFNWLIYKIIDCM